LVSSIIRGTALLAALWASAAPGAAERPEDRWNLADLYPSVRQAMFAEFEREVHARVDRGEPLSGDRLTQIYGEILRRYHGDNEGVVKIDDLYTVEWAYIPHFYRPFYVFQYATSIAASSLLADAVLKGEPGARERYLKLLSAGGSDYPYELVKAAGVDLARSSPYRAVVARMNRIMDQIEAIQARR
jgi:oligoendopeptidase F